MEFTKQYPVIRYEDGRETPSMDEVLAECSLNVHINGRCTEVLHCIPEYLEEMLLGRLYTSGVISSPEDIMDLSICPSLNRADLKIRETHRTMVRLPDLHICPDHILSLSQHLLDASELFRKTGNVHSVMLCRDCAVLYMTEDLDRSRAFEKTVGRALKDRVDFAGTSVYTTGRIPRPIAEKAIWAGIPVIVSRSAPTDLTLELAAEYNLTVIGFARRNRMNIYRTSRDGSATPSFPSPVMPDM